VDYGDDPPPDGWITWTRSWADETTELEWRSAVLGHWPPVYKKPDRGLAGERESLTCAEAVTCPWVPV